MAMEIEYKFKVDREKFFKYIEEKGIKPALHSRQGYINTDNDAISSLRWALIDHYDAEGNVIDGNAEWTINCDFLDKLQVDYINNTICISVDDLSLLNKSFELFLNNDENTKLTITIVGLI